MSSGRPRCSCAIYIYNLQLNTVFILGYRAQPWTCTLLLLDVTLLRLLVNLIHMLVLSALSTFWRTRKLHNINLIHTTLPYSGSWSQDIAHTGMCGMGHWGMNQSQPTCFAYLNYFIKFNNTYIFFPIFHLFFQRLLWNY